MSEIDPFAKYAQQTEEEQQLGGVGTLDDSPDPFAKYSTPEKTNEIEADIASGEWTSLDSLSGALVFIEGATLGWSDEVGIGLASLAMSAGSEETQEEIPLTASLKTDWNCANISAGCFKNTSIVIEAVFSLLVTCNMGCL